MSTDFHLAHGDCLSWLARVPKRSIDLAILDPGPWGRLTRPGPGKVKVPSFDAAQGPTLLYEVSRVLRPGAVCWWLCEGAQSFQIVRWAEGLGLVPGTPMVWDRGPDAALRLSFIVPLSVGRARSPGAELFVAPRPQGSEVWPGELPLNLASLLIEAASEPGDWVLDPFAGRATAGEAAIRSGRHYLGIDCLEAAVDQSQQRLSATPGRSIAWSDVMQALSADAENTEQTPRRNEDAQLSIFGDGPPLR